MAINFAVSHVVRRVDTLGAIRFISGASKLTLAPRRHQMQIKLRLKPVAAASPHLPAQRLAKEAEKGSPRFSFWEKTPGEHFKDYLESLLPPGPHTKLEASGIANLVSILWLTVVPLLLWGCPWIPFNYLDSNAFVGVISYIAIFFNWFCARCIRFRSRKESEMQKGNGR